MIEPYHQIDLTTTNMHAKKDKKNMISDVSTIARLLFQWLISSNLTDLIGYCCHQQYAFILYRSRSYLHGLDRSINRKDVQSYRQVLLVFYLKKQNLLYSSEIEPKVGGVGNLHTGLGLAHTLCWLPADFFATTGCRLHCSLQI